MDIVCRSSIYDDYIDIVASQMIQKSMRQKFKWVVYELNTNKIIGFIRFGSVLFNSKLLSSF